MSTRRADRIEIERDDSIHSRRQNHGDFIFIYTTKWEDRGTNQWDGKLIAYHGTWKENDELDRALREAVNEILDQDLLDYF